MSYLSENKAGEILLNIYVQPKSSNNRIVGLHGEAIKICITSPPVDGKANAAVIAFLAKLFKLPKSAITLAAGQMNRHKRFAVTGLALPEVRGIIERNLP